MKNPQIAQFLKEQIELQERDDGSYNLSRSDPRKLSSAAGQNTNVTVGTNKIQQNHY